MALVPRHFCAFELNPTSALFRAAEAVTAGPGCAIESSTTPPAGHGTYALACSLNVAALNTYEAHDIPGTDDENQYFITEISVNFSDVDTQLQTDPVYAFAEFAANSGADIEWSLEIEGGSGVGYSTHRLVFVSSTGARTVLANDPFANNTYATIETLWKHRDAVVCWFKINGANPNVNSFAVADCLTAGAGNATVGRMNFRGPVGTPALHGHPRFSMYVHSEADGTDDLASGVNFGIKDIRITGKAGTNPDFGFGAGGKATVTNTADNITDDARTTYQQVARHSLGTEWGAAYACHLSDVVGGPSGRFGVGTDIFLYKFAAFGRWSSTSSFGRLAIGRAPHDVSSSAVNISTVALSGANQGWEAVIESGDADFPIADDGDWLVVGVGNEGGIPTDFCRWTEQWGWALYDQSTGQDREQVAIRGECEIKGKCLFVG